MTSLGGASESSCLHVEISSSPLHRFVQVMRADSGDAAQVYAAQLREAQASGRPDPPLSVGFCHELCAGIIDKQMSLQEISHEEVCIPLGWEGWTRESM